MNKKEKLVEDIEKELGDGYSIANTLPLSGEGISMKIGDLKAVIINLEKFSDKVHQSNLIGRDLINDYIMDEISFLKRKLKNLEKD